MTDAPAANDEKNDPTFVDLANMDKDEKEMEQKMVKTIAAMPK